MDEFLLFARERLFTTRDPQAPETLIQSEVAIERIARYLRCTPRDFQKSGPASGQRHASAGSRTLIVIGHVASRLIAARIPGHDDCDMLRMHDDAQRPVRVV